MTIAPGEDVPPSEERNTGEFKIHYHLRGDAHFMDAVARNNAEREMLALLKEVGDTLAIPFQVETRAYGEGGLVEYLELVFKNKEHILFVMGVLGTLLGTPFYLAKIKQTKQQTDLNDLNLKKLRIEIREREEAAADRATQKQNNGQSTKLALEPPLTPDEIAKALLARKKVARRRSNYYEALLADSKIEAVGFASTHRKSAPEQVVRRSDFGTFVIALMEVEPLHYERVPVEVVAPVLRPGSLKWRALFEKKPISFDLLDGQFRDQISGQRVQFQNGTTLVCDLEVLQRENETGETEVVGYAVTRVHDVKSPPAAAKKSADEQLSLKLGHHRKAVARHVETNTAVEPDITSAPSEARPPPHSQ